MGTQKVIDNMMTQRHLDGYPLPPAEPGEPVVMIGKGCAECIAGLRAAIAAHLARGTCRTCPYERHGCPYKAALAWATDDDGR